jgi:transcriptional regulator with XRE-family HTH domain
MYYMNSLASKRIRERRKALGLNQAELSDLTGISQGQISRYEIGDNEPTAEVLIRLARVLQTTADYLIGLSDQSSLTPDESNLSDNERYLIEIYRSKPLDGQARLIDVAKVV